MSVAAYDKLLANLSSALVTPDDALALLRAHAFTLVTIAGETVRRRPDFSNLQVSGD